MNTFKFVGNIVLPKDNQLIKKTSSGNKVLKILIKQNENNSAYVRMNSDFLFNGNISIMNKNKERVYVPFENRFDKNIINNASYVSKYITNISCPIGTEMQFLWKEDFMNYVSEHIVEYPPSTVFIIEGEFVITYYQNKQYYNFSIRSIKLAVNERLEFTMKLDLFYNYEGLDESNKKDSLILNAYVLQYVKTLKKKQFVPLQVEFITNRFNFKNPTDVEIIKHRKANMYPPKENGFVKAKWEAQYIRGAQLIMPPIETLPKDIQFEIKNAGRDIKEYMSSIVSEAKECICLTRPDNTLSKDGAVYTPLKCTDNEFKSNIYNIENISTNTIDKIAENEAKQNPFNS